MQKDEQVPVSIHFNKFQLLAIANVRNNYRVGI